MQKNNEGKEECKREPDRTKKTQRQCGWMQERRWFYNYTSFTDHDCMYDWKMKSALSLFLDAQSHTYTHTYTSSVETLDCFDPFKSSFPGSANHIALCARNPHRPGNHEVIWVEQAASVVVPKLLLWSGRET